MYMYTVYCVGVSLISYAIVMMEIIAMDSVTLTMPSTSASMLVVVGHFGCFNELHNATNPAVKKDGYRDNHG